MNRGIRSKGDKLMKSLLVDFLVSILKIAVFERLIGFNGRILQFLILTDSKRLIIDGFLSFQRPG